MSWLLKNEWHQPLDGDKKIGGNLPGRDRKGMSRARIYDDYGEVSAHAFGAGR